MLKVMADASATSHVASGLSAQPTMSLETIRMPESWDAVLTICYAADMQSSMAGKL
jgi:hypothetical protein